MKTFLVIQAVCTLSLLVSGCATRGGYSRDAVRRQDADVSNMKMQLIQLADRVEAMKVDQQKVYEELDVLRAEVKGKDAAMAAGLEKVNRDLKVMEAAQQRDKAEIGGLIKSISGSVSAQPVRGGYEHVVKAGETLSQIASAYKVTIDAIVRANSLKNANAIRVGQKLFIPE